MGGWMEIVGAAPCGRPDYGLRMPVVGKMGSGFVVLDSGFWILGGVKMVEFGGGIWYNTFSTVIFN